MAFYRHVRDAMNGFNNNNNNNNNNNMLANKAPVCQRPQRLMTS